MNLLPSFSLPNLPGVKICTLPIKLFVKNFDVFYLRNPDDLRQSWLNLMILENDKISNFHQLIINYS